MGQKEEPRFKVGQEVIRVGSGFYARTHGGALPSIDTFVITKVGRSWVTVKTGRYETRFNKATMIEDGRGYTPGGRFYLTREDYERKRDLMAALDALYDEVAKMRSGRRVPPGLKASDIVDAASFLYRRQEVLVAIERRRNTQNG